MRIWGLFFRDLLVLLWRAIDALLNSHFAYVLILIGIMYLLLSTGTVTCDPHISDGCF